MCGFAGFTYSPNAPFNVVQMLRSMLSRLVHRGPDDSGVWVDELNGVALGHRRLAVLDLSPAGHQPMKSTCGRYTLVFNGEIYNHLELRALLLKQNTVPSGGWRGHSDTETLLACFAVWGVERTLSATVGMFALALWDRNEKTLTLARDRVGEKPLYYGWQQGVFLFGSELKALRAHPSFKGDIDWDAAAEFFRWNYIPAPLSIYRGVCKLLPGTWLTLTSSDITACRTPQPVSYWSLADVAQAGQQSPFQGDFQEAIDHLDLLVRQAVRLQSVADVPVGAFLSGGIDSSLVTALMQNETSAKVTTFSIGMPDAPLDESRHAAAVARYLGTNHVEHVIQPREALELVPRLSEIWDEPFADSSQIPTYLVAKLARERVTVTLSGDGGDEFFLGYPQYPLFRSFRQSRYLGCLPWNSAFRLAAPLRRVPAIDRTLRRAGRVVGAWRQPNGVALDAYWADRYQGRPVPLSLLSAPKSSSFPALRDPATAAALRAAATYLPDDILVKVDRAAMANSLETRAPLLDHRIMEFALALPPGYRLHGRIGKTVLREVLYRHVPKNLVDRPKMGFSIPLGPWLRKELHPYVDDIIRCIPTDGVIDKKQVEIIWGEHKAGVVDHAERIWAIVALVSSIKSAL